jgi:ABC-type nickel/cobalt efflux system permease component RcnA
MAAATPVPATAGGVPGGVNERRPCPPSSAPPDLSPLVLLVSILTAAALGAGHALTPGHGKTLMAAYLVGTRGRRSTPAGLGLSVTFSHTLGILVLAALVVGAGGFLLRTSSSSRRRWWRPSRSWRSAAGCWSMRVAGAGGSAPPRPHTLRPMRTGRARHEHEHAPATTRALNTAMAAAPTATSSPAGTTISWRSLFVLGLAGV